jgi:MFS family permease
MFHALANLSTFRSLGNRDWRILWMAGHLWHLAFWMDLIVLGWLMLELTDSPFLVALVGTCRLIPMGVLGVLAGSLGDRLPKRKLLIIAQLLNLTVTVGFTVVLLLDLERVWLIYVVALLTGSAWSIDFPIRRAFIRDLLPASTIVNAMAIDAASLFGMALVGRVIGGGLLAASGPPLAYGFLVVCYALGLILLLRVPEQTIEPSQSESSPSVLNDIVAGLSYVWRNPALRGILLVTVIINFLVAPYFQLTPVFARDIFGVGPGLLGLISGMDGLGALIGALVLASLTGLVRLGMVFAVGSLIFAVGVLFFSQAPTYQLAMPFLVLVGLGTSGFAAMQTTITVTQADPEMRGRAMGAVALGIGVLPLGMAFVGGLAELMGAAEALGLTSLIGLGFIVMVLIVQPAVRRARQ